MAASTAVSIEDVPGRQPSAERVAEVDALTGLRGFAALVVVSVHAAGRTSYPQFGIHGYGPVSLFVLSGFLLYRPFSRWALGLARYPSLRMFARRRILRIFPAYWLVLFAFAVMLPASQPLGWDGWLRGLTLTGTLASDGLRPGLEQTWSLGTELSWYIALPVLGMLTGLVARRLGGRRGFFAVILLMSLSLPVTIAWRIWTEVEDLGKEYTYSFWLPGFLICFAGGAAVSHFLEGEGEGLVDLSRVRGWMRHSWLVLALVVAIAATGTSPLGGPHLYEPATFSERQVRFFCATAVAVLLLMICVLSRPEAPLVRFFSTRSMTATGRWSYGIYLWHLPVINLVQDDFTARSGVGGFFLWMGFVFAVTIPLGAATYAWVERPAMAFSKRSRSGVRRGDRRAHPRVDGSGQDEGQQHGEIDHGDGPHQLGAGVDERGGGDHGREPQPDDQSRGPVLAGDHLVDHQLHQREQGSQGREQPDVRSDAFVGVAADEDDREVAEHRGAGRGREADGGDGS